MVGSGRSRGQSERLEARDDGKVREGQTTRGQPHRVSAARPLRWGKESKEREERVSERREE